MAGLHLEFVSPESVLFSGDVDQVDLPGSEGDMGILPHHAPLVTSLRPGIVTIFRDGRREPIVVIGGFAEVGPSGLTVLADKAVPREDFDMAELAGEIKDAEEDVADSKDPAARDKLLRHLDQLKALQAALSSSPMSSAGSSSPASAPRRDAPAPH
jgi:F-type H+-transporting ATPase subunit epsilon